MLRRHAQLLGTGRYIPQRCVPNDAFADRFGPEVGPWLEANVGIRVRHVMAEEETTSDLVVSAATQALDRVGLDPEDLDLILVATDTPDYISPATSSVVQHKLGAARAGTFDVNAALRGLGLRAGHRGTLRADGPTTSATCSSAAATE